GRHAVFEKLLAAHLTEQRWIAYDTVERILEGLPSRSAVFADFDPDRQATLLEHLADEEARALDFLGSDPRARVAATNDEILRRELASRRAFFDQVEKSPLTEEQASAVVALDNRVRVIAAAGSGKTSVMVARAAYVIERGFISP